MKYGFMTIKEIKLYTENNNIINLIYNIILLILLYQV